MNAKLHLDRNHLQHLYREMLRIRRFEAKCVELYQAQEIRGYLHLYDGEEAVAVGVLSALQPGDAVVATYREHGQALARGVPMERLMAEMLGRQEGCCRGRGGSMHVFDAGRRFFGGNAIVAGGLPLAAGIALADRRLGRGSVTACFFGEGAVTEGAFHETMNLASLWRLPLLFVCENNLYAMGTPLADADAEPEIHRRAEAYRMPATSVDGMDVVAVEAAAARGVAHMRAGEGPFFLECRTYRFRAHSMFDVQAYRTREEVEDWRGRDPIARLRRWMLDNRHATEAQLTDVDQTVEHELAAAVAFARAGTPEPVEELERFVSMDHVPQEAREGGRP
ncbi:pyruvate dehydrogenase (acetyl-transferring) E1 component subunit alpha [Ramlibacter sp. MMS24-I3-19]|uniref:pyruvate dehydrogenase (acetyl-transferring) E1 component subunit alpha n=1 Tax=Ramlibacter sp. MMS24-I3-19 TaxID=3416606 RepID=UPI003D05EECB